MQQSDQDIRNRLLVARLPAMPQILIQLIEHLQLDDAGMADLARLIAKDAGMTAKLLGVANSSAYHRNGRGVSLEQALVSLGTDMIKTLVISESVFQTFNNFPHAGGTDLRPFWRQSLTAAVIARDVAKALDYPHTEEAYLAGLLHNVGRLALLATAPREYAHNFQARDDDMLCLAEQRTLQITHAEAGAWLIERWHLDSFLADAVLYHHEPLERLATSHPLIRIVRLAHLLSDYAPEQAAVDEAASLCGLSASALDAIVKTAARQVALAAERLGIDLAASAEAPPQAVLQDPVRQRLADEVRNMVLVAEVGQSLARQQGEAGLVEAMTRSARILFDFAQALILLENPTGLALVGAPGGELQQRLAEFSIALGKGGIVATCAIERRPAYLVRAAPGLGVAEEQLLRMLGTEAAVCLPLVAGQRCLGVLVGGLAGWQLAPIERRERFMQAFGNEAAGALETAWSERGHARRQLAHVADEYREASRRVVHEVNNPLAIIKNYLSVLDTKLARKEAVTGEMSILNEEIDRVGQLINGLADLTPSGAPGVTDAAKVVGDVLRLFRATDFVPPTVQIGANLGQAPSDIDGDPELLKQILVNLVKNAVEAQGAGGRVTIENRGHVNRDRRLYVELVVSDAGPGLSDEVLANLFSAVRSDKDGAHRGLGLSIVHSLVKKMHGQIACRSGAQGTSFEILLPAHASVSSVAAAV